MKKIKKFVKTNTKIVIAFIAGIIVASLIGVSAATILYNANQVSFTAEDSDFDATNVESALNKLYEKSKYIDSMSSSNTVVGSFTVNGTTTQSINVGFQPSRVLIYTPVATDNNRIMCFYDKNIEEAKIMCGFYKTDTTTGKGFAFYNLSEVQFTISNTGFTYRGFNNSFWSGKTYYYAIK